MSKPLLIEIEYDKTMTFVFVNPVYSKPEPATLEYPGAPGSLEWDNLYLKGDPKENDLTDLFEEQALGVLEEKLLDQCRPRDPSDEP